MVTQILPYHPHSAELFEHFAHLPQAVLLDSCLPQQHQGRYDIISAMPIQIIDDASDMVFTHIQTALDALKVEHNTATPFSMGAIGYLSYDMGRQLEKIPTIAKNDIHIPTACIGIYDWSIVVDHLEKKTTLHAIDAKKANIILALLDKAEPAKAPFQLTSAFESNLSKDDYEKAFDNIKKNIIAGNCYQVNFAQRFSATFSGSTWEAYKILREKNPAPFSAYLNFKDGAVLSCSPERFLKIQDNLVETKPIKGTAKRSSDPIEDQLFATQLLNSEKDRAENVMIVDLLRNDLSRTCTDVTVQQLCALESFSNVHHLVSTITGKLSENTAALDVFKNCFPGGSITGAPKIAAMKIIEALEPHRRSLYCGSIFYADAQGNFDSSIVIRTAICDNNQIHCYAGGGIVYDSVCESEYAEIRAKIGKMIAVLEENK